MKFIIEHLEDEMYEWCVLEYGHISEIIGKDNLIFTNVKEGSEKISGLGEIKQESVVELGLKSIVVLDPFADKVLSEEDNKFDHVILGGILGDYPMKKRTKTDLLDRFKENVETRSLGKEQMTTNTAALVAKMLLQGKKLEEIEFMEEIEVQTGDGESVILPFKYVVEDGKPILPEGMIDLLKKEDA